ncbi:MAG TPA: VOC family protein [Candidatus Paceibacterota bacterium]|nr:VOC family protein [Candidatus Paceibacterota bacterium]
MARVSTYLNFKNQTEEAFNYYKTVFGTEFIGEINRFGEVPKTNSMSEISEEEKNLVMHVALPILGGHIIMGTDMPESMGFPLKEGNSMYLTLEPDSRAEADRLFTALTDGGKIEMPMQEMFWGDYYGSFTDKFGVKWMINCSSKQ